MNTLRSCGPFIDSITPTGRAAVIEAEFSAMANGLDSDSDTGHDIDTIGKTRWQTPPARHLPFSSAFPTDLASRRGVA